MFNYWASTQASMILSNFNSKLRQLNDRLYIRDDKRTMRGTLPQAGIYLKMTRQSGLSYETQGHGEAGQEKYFRMLETGELDRFLCGICPEWIPEFDVIHADYSRIAVMGWRTILIRLAGHKVITLEKARRVFGCPSLGESDYDKASYFNKMQIAKRLDHAE